MQLNAQLTKRSKFNLVQGDPNLIHNNPLNSSSSKMQYSMPKSKRWSEQKTTTRNSKFYDLPQLKSNRSTSFGFGNKTDIAKQNKFTPSPMNYTICGDFERKGNKIGITFGAGRDIVKNVSTFNQKPYKVPGPQDYDVKYCTIQNGPKYSISGRQRSSSQKWIESIPGPGTYSTMQLVKNNNKLSVSKFQSSPSMSFGKHKRLSDYEQKIRLLNVPGPGKYKIQSANHNVQRFTFYDGKKFGRSQRKGIAQKSITPGPGSYRIFSEFIY